MPRNGSGQYSRPAGTTAISGATIESAKFNELTGDFANDLNVPRPVVAGGTGAGTPSAARTNLGIAIGTDVQGYDAGLASIAGLTVAADQGIYATGPDTYATFALGSLSRTFLANTTEAGLRSTLGLTRLDEDNMASNRADAVASQQSIKAYVDAKSQILHVRDEKTSGTNGGTATAGLFQRRDLNTVETNTIPGASLSASQFTLPAGTYDIQASAPAFEAGGHQARLYNATDGTYPIIGGNEVNGADRIGSTRALVAGRFTIAATKVFELRHRVSATQSSNGYGVALGFGTEVYADVIVRKIA